MPPRRLTHPQIADDLAARIDAGEYPVGSKLPTYAELRDIYSGVARHHSARDSNSASPTLCRGHPRSGRLRPEKVGRMHLFGCRFVWLRRWHSC